MDKMVSGLSIREPEELGITDVRVISELALMCCVGPILDL